jgi:DNA helicase-2/ATP-dependent DNA helicase PcrA
MAKELTTQGIRPLQSGDHAKARELLSAAVRQDPSDAIAWLWLSGAVETDAERLACLQRVLAIDPRNPSARRGLEILHKRSSPDPEAEDILSGLTGPQKEAVLHQGSPLLIIAGPGSGKTEVIARRVAHLVHSGTIKPEEALAVTFTERAALGLKDRIQRKLPEVNAEGMQVSTIHAFAALLLRRYSAQSALPHGFRLLDETGQFLYVYSRRTLLGLGQVVKGRPQDFYAAVLRIFNLATEELVTPARLADWCHAQLADSSPKDAPLWEERQVIASAYRTYCDLLREDGLIDFAFLQRHALSLLEDHPEIVRELRDKYRAILVDEYQDTNAAQERLIALLAGQGQGLTVVGDDDNVRRFVHLLHQVRKPANVGIYRFRGATVKNILTFPGRYPHTHKVVLTDNFRSREPTLDHAMQVIEENPARYPKHLQAVRGPGSEVLLVYEHSAAEEAGSVVSLLRRLHKAGRIAHFGDVGERLPDTLQAETTFSYPFQQDVPLGRVPSLHWSRKSWRAKPT